MIRISTFSINPQTFHSKKFPFDIRTNSVEIKDLFLNQPKCTMQKYLIPIIFNKLFLLFVSTLCQLFLKPVFAQWHVEPQHSVCTLYEAIVKTKRQMGKADAEIKHERKDADASHCLQNAHRSCEGSALQRDSRISFLYPSGPFLNRNSRENASTHSLEFVK